MSYLSGTIALPKSSGGPMRIPTTTVLPKPSVFVAPVLKFPVPILVPKPAAPVPVPAPTPVVPIQPTTSIAPSTPKPTISLAPTISASSSGTSPLSVLKYKEEFADEKTSSDFPILLLALAGLLFLSQKKRGR